VHAQYPWRVGVGYDIHRLVDGRPLKLGGVEVDHPQGLLGHSDGDVVLHAVADALLGAAGMPDIGELFPDTDPAYEDADSRALLRTVMERLSQAHVAPVNVDCIVHAESPRISPYKRRMAETIADLVNVPIDAVSIKATTNEGLGPVGTGHAIACTATALVARTGAETDAERRKWRIEN
jgi:2-C-methyl-D-erythritol 2,4-cyclodiphosphate synthase